MNAPNSALPPRPLPLKPKWIATACLLLVVYLLLRPWLVERYGWDLPGFTDTPATTAPVTPPRSNEPNRKHRPLDVPMIPERNEPIIEDGPVVAVTQEDMSSEDSTTSAVPVESPTDLKKTRSTKRPESTTPPISKPQIVRSPKTTSTEKPAPSTVVRQNPPPKSTTPAPGQATAESQKPQLGALKQTGRDRFESTAGLVYNQYRIDHVMDHARDNLEKPSHGVFEVTTQEAVLALIDEAYQIAQKRGPPQVIIEDEGDRTAYTVNMNRKIGHPGGQNGGRNRNRPLNKIKIVVEDKEVVTAYPTN